MTTDMFNALDVLGSWFGGFASGGGLVAIGFLLHRRSQLDLAEEARTDRAAAEKTWAENDRQRWAPMYRDLTGEVEAVRDHDDTPALSDLSHDEEQVTADDLGAIGPDDWRMPWWGWPLAAAGVVVLVPAWLVWLAWDWARGVVERQRERRASRDRLDGDETPLPDADEPAFTLAEQRAIVGVTPELDAAADRWLAGEVPTEPAAELEAATEVPTPVAVTIEQRRARYLPTGAYPLVRVTGDKGGRHRAGAK